MTVLEIRFLPGRFHATPWNDGARGGDVEWPPSPWSLLRSIVAGWYTSGGGDFAGIRSAIDALAAPPRYVLPPWKTRPAYGATAHPQNERTELVLDSFVTSRGDAAVAYVIWDDVMFDSRERELLAKVCEQITLLGQSSTPCNIRLASRPPANDPDHVNVDLVARSANPGFLIRRLGVAADVRGNGLFQRLSGSAAEISFDGNRQVSGSVWFDYALPASTTLLHDNRPSVRQMPAHIERFAIEAARGSRRPPLTSAIRVAELVRAAAMKAYTTREQDDAPPVLSGKAARNVSALAHRHAYFLPQDVDEDGLIDHIDIVFPEAYSHEVHRAVLSIREIWSSDLNLAAHERLLVRNIGEADYSIATEWTTVTPFVLDRFPRRGQSSSDRIAADSPEAQLRRSLIYHGFPEPLTIDLTRNPIQRSSGAPIPLEHFRRTRKTDPALPAFHATIRFASPQQGPIALGRYAHFGLGQFTASQAEAASQ